jgi:hypothetical protein
MTAKDVFDNLMFRVKHMHEFVVITDVSPNFGFNGVVPFDMNIKENVITAKVWAVDFNEAVQRLDDYLNSCQDE